MKVVVNLFNLFGNMIDVGFMIINVLLLCGFVILIFIKFLLIYVVIEVFCNCINEICLSFFCNCLIIGIVWLVELLLI